ncbi:anti-sigma factor family protein, partial [Sphingosinicella sp.]|uniref:anti-sigma factor family protein n=1 Tax=Sphingosinicella sp. TaxID=1917971 RepID=UPI004037FE52
MTVDTALLLAYLDGELDAQEAKRVEDALAASAALRAELEAQRRLRDQLAAHYAPALDEAVPQQLRALLEPKVVDFAAARQRRFTGAWWAPTALAASLVLGIAIGRLLPAGGEFGASDGALVARGALAEALSTQLASAQQADATTRIGVSFARADGSLCRTFASANISGL